MVTALFGADGRAATAHAGLMLAQALATTGRPTTLIRVVGPGEGMAGLPPCLARDLEVIEYRAELPDLAGPGVDGHLSAALEGGRQVVLDMPLASLADGDFLRRVALPVLLVGPDPLDERFAAQAIRDLACRAAPPDTGTAPPVWLLGCGRTGGAAAAVRFEAAMARALALAGLDAPVRALPVTLPALGRAEAEALARAGSTPRLQRAAILALAAFEATAADPRAPAIDRAAFAEAIGLGVSERVTADDRVLHERLRDLADDLAFLEENGGTPREEDLAAAPLLDEFAFDWDPGARLMTGIVHGHQNWSAPCGIRTSQVFATDGVTFARSLSRLYRLGRRAGAADVH